MSQDRVIALLKAHKMDEASQEQSAGVGQINGAMGQLNKATQQNASASEELAATAEEMRRRTDELQEMLKFFAVGGSQAFESATPQRRLQLGAGPAPAAG